MSNQIPIVRLEVVETTFGLYSYDEICNMSVCKITSPLMEDALGNALPGGLYDPKLGPTEQQKVCPTCSFTYMQCPGHQGHIELDVPVYHPLLFNSMFQLLRSKCISCHKMRMAPARVAYYKARLQLIEMDDSFNLEILDQLAYASTVTLISDDKSNDTGSNDKTVSDFHKQIEIYDRRYNIFKRKHNNNNSNGSISSNSNNENKNKVIDSQLLQLQKHTIDELFKECNAVRRCDHCNTPKPTYRKDGYTKIFQKSMSKSDASALKSLKKKNVSALEVSRRNNADDLLDSDDDDANRLIDSGDDEQQQKPSGSEKYLAPLEVEAQVRLLWDKHHDLYNIIWGRSSKNITANGANNDGWKLFFIRYIVVPPNRFRPASKVGDSTADHPQNYHLSKILDANEKIRQSNMHFIKDQREAADDIDAVDSKMPVDLSKVISIWIDLQNAVNCYIDNTKDPNVLGSVNNPPGIRQLLEKKEGLFRGNMMGKRVNYCCRSVISPDPYIGTNEIGIPVHFAKSLHYPTHVNNHNVKHLYNLVIRGANEYPGANLIETAEGKIIKLDKLNAAEREGKAKMLLTSPGNKVYRHLVDGDVLLVNRQPTLHKPGIMAHKARVLKHVKEQTLRMNYANCNTYNADFDGDEMNCHFVQDELARAEANFICNTDNQYIVPTSGTPLRGLIQDHVASGVKMTCKDTFLTRAEFQQLLYVAVSGLPGTEIITPMETMKMPPPAILKPKRMWTGKQVISSLMAHMCAPPLPSLNLDGKARTPPTAFGAVENEHNIIFRHGELLCGVIDKASIGNSSLGIVHAVYELYGPELAGRLLNAFGRLFTYYLQDAGHTCGIADLILTKQADVERKVLLEKVVADADKGLQAFLDGKSLDSTTYSINDMTDVERYQLRQQSEKYMTKNRKDAKVTMDGTMQSIINKSASNVIKVCLPNGLQTNFIHNNFSMMVLTGAKGSAVNQSQISCFLGQQALEGQRVPVMVSGKTLPSFRPYDCSARAGGFVRDRFLTGIKPQEFYFHCMAGREGLVDTAVKTSRSGYLQRCLVKHLEELRVHYDMTVRDSAGNIIQFLYGDDGIDPVHTGLLEGKSNQMLFLARNTKALMHKYSIDEDKFASKGLECETARLHNSRFERAKQLIKTGKFVKTSIVLARMKRHIDTKWKHSNLRPGWTVAEIIKVRTPSSDDSDTVLYDLKYMDGSVEKKVPAAMSVATKDIESVNATSTLTLIKAGLPDTAMSLLKLGDSLGACSEKMQDAINEYINKNPDNILADESSSDLQIMLWVKYMKSLAAPGEAVGCVAAQSVGEPSTQMTLNTFHLAGHGGANVTLGIPRLREIIMTASQKLKTPTMTIPMVITDDMDMTAKLLARKLSRLPLSTLLHHIEGIEVKENILSNADGKWVRRYNIRLKFESMKIIKKAFDCSFDDILHTIKSKYIEMLIKLTKNEERKAKLATIKRSDDSFNFRGSNTNRVNNDEGDAGSDVDNAGVDADDNDDDGGVSSSSKSRGKKSKESITKLLDGSDDDDDDEEDDAEKEGRSNKDNTIDDDDDDDVDDAIVTSSKKVNELDEIDFGSDDDDVDNAVNASNSSSKGEVDEDGHGILLNSEVSQGMKRCDVRLHSDEVNGWVELSLSYPSASRRFLMAQLAEDAANATTVRSTTNITNAYPCQVDVNGKEVAAVTTEGVNFESIWELSPSIVQYNEIRSNDIYQILLSYGVEAARHSIVSEIQGVFAVYGINVNARHLSLIADFMTRAGSFIPMNRMGILNSTSPLLQMSYESTCTFLTRAAELGLTDNLQSPTAQIVLGNNAKVGTGAFDVLLKI